MASARIKADAALRLRGGAARAWRLHGTLTLHFTLHIYAFLLFSYLSATPLHVTQRDKPMITLFLPHLPSIALLLLLPLPLRGLSHLPLPLTGGIRAVVVACGGWLRFGRYLPASFHGTTACTTFARLVDSSL